ncbi:addiction module toxin RelE [Kosakonia sp. H7A]|nr:addiction module toxin RelE [Kosakonia sp. MH5]PTA88108.1 addiction module toxin RelE [Kosakonia sp. H7A]
MNALSPEKDKATWTVVYTALFARHRGGKVVYPRALTKVSDWGAQP